MPRSSGAEGRGDSPRAQQPLLMPVHRPAQVSSGSLMRVDLLRGDWRKGPTPIVTDDTDSRMKERISPNPRQGRRSRLKERSKPVRRPVTTGVEPLSFPRAEVGGAEAAEERHQQPPPEGQVCNSANTVVPGCQNS